MLTIHGYETIFQVSNFAGSTEAVFKTLEKEFQELERYDRWASLHPMSLLEKLIYVCLLLLLMYLKTCLALS